MTYSSRRKLKLFKGQWLRALVLELWLGFWSPNASALFSCHGWGCSLQCSCLTFRALHDLTPLPPSLTQGDLALIRLLSLLPQECVTCLSVCSSFIHYSYIEDLPLPGSENTRAKEPLSPLGRLLVQHSGPYTCSAIARMEDCSLVCCPAGSLALFSFSCEKSRRPVGESNIIQEKAFIFSKLQKIIVTAHYLQTYI